MARRKSSGRVSFKTRRGKRVSFKLTGRGHRKGTAQQKRLGRAAKKCKGKGKIGGKQRTSCIISELKKMKRAG